MENYILIAKDIIKQYNNYIALDRINISVPRGSIYGLLGPNGAGKTTLMRIINQIILPDSGEIKFNNNSLEKYHISEIGYLPEERGLYKKMKAGNQVLYLAQLKGMNYSDAIRQGKYWFQKLNIINYWDKRIEELSKGMAQKIQFIATVIHKPKLLIFDEPFTGFDPINASIIKKEILRLKDDGATIILSTHRMESVEEICTHIALINKSKTILEGSISNIKESFSSQEYKINLSKLIINKKNKNFSILKKEGNSYIISLNKENIQDIIKSINKYAGVIEFTKQNTSMEDIFIKTINNE
jgi:ABC-2 type transport system ATP-binding protein